MTDKESIDFETLPIGTIFYHVYKRCNVLRQRKITFTDDDGNIWYRYDKPAFEYVIIKYKLFGRLKKVLQGQGIEFYDLETEYLIQNQSNEVEDFFPEKEQFYTLDLTEAEAMAAQKNKELKND